VTLPTYDRFIEPILRFLAKFPSGAPAREAHDEAAQALALTEDQRAERLPSGVQPVYKNRAGWAHDRLKRSGLSSSPRRGFWCLTSQGFDFVKSHPAPLAPELLATISDQNLDVPLKPLPPGGTGLVQPAAIAPIASPDDRLEEALRELRMSVGAEILEAIFAASPAFFETLVLDLLHAMGYGTSRSDLQRVGGAGDGGIDGVISLDRLGLEKVYVQAKRWHDQVGRPDVQAFYGALAGQRAKKGVFITTSGYTAQAIDFARSVEGVVLVDGKRLTELMIEHGVGVTHRTIQVAKLDSDYFEE